MYNKGVMESNRYNFARDGFVYLLNYATLMISSIGFNFLAKSLVDKAIPDAIERGSFLNNDATIVGFLAAVIIAFPIFMYLNYWANKMLGKGKMRHNTGVRHWLINITLVVVILVIIWQLIALFIAFLNGTLALRFLLHTLITLLVSAAVLWYQWWHLKFFDGNKKKLGLKFKIFEWSIITVVVAVIVGAFIVIDSPTVRRMKRLDATRIERLSMLQNSIHEFYGWGSRDLNYGRLPVGLDELLQNSKMFFAEDALLYPVTRERFEYRVVSSRTYELCAIFDTEFTAEDDSLGSFEFEPMSVNQPQRFYHGIGRTCFELYVEE